MLRDPDVSAVHARLDCNDAGCALKDLGSAKGVLVNGRRVSEIVLKAGDTITIGTTKLALEAVPHEAVDEDATRIDLPTEAHLADTSISIQIQDNVLPRVVVRTVESTTETEMSGDVLNIGRASDNDIVIPLPTVSRHHARVERKRSGFFLRDLESENGVWMGRFRISQAKLQHGDSFRIGGAQLVFKHNFALEDLATSGVRDETSQCPIIFVPGFAGSKLWLGSEQIWPRLGQLRAGGNELKLGENSSVEARGLVDQVVIIPGIIKLEQYRRVSDYLVEGLGYERDKNLLEFAYDFRQDIRNSARALAVAIERWKVPKPITIIAHSRGCLVSRYYVDQLNGHRKVGRMILMGGPHCGAPKAFTTLLVGPKLLPFGWLDDQLRDAFATFPSTYQLLPSYSCVSDNEGTDMDVLADDSWLPTTQRQMLAPAKELQRELSPHSLVPSVSIFGYGMKTITNVKVKREANGSFNVQPVVEAKGDSTVPERSAMLHGSEIHPVRQYQDRAVNALVHAGLSLAERQIFAFLPDHSDLLLDCPADRGHADPRGRLSAVAFQHPFATGTVKDKNGAAVGRDHFHETVERGLQHLLGSNFGASFPVQFA